MFGLDGAVIVVEDLVNLLGKMRGHLLNYGAEVVDLIHILHTSLINYDK